MSSNLRDVDAVSVGLCAAEEQKTLADGSILRLFKTTPFSSTWLVQKIENAGVFDQRRRSTNRETRRILFSTADHAEAVQYFEST